MQHALAPGQPVVQTLARFGKCAICQDLTVDRLGNIYAAVCESHDKPTHVLQLMPGSNELVQLPVRLDEHMYGVAVSPSGQELYQTLYSQGVLVHRAPWADRSGEMLPTEHMACDIEYCDDNRYVLLFLSHLEAATCAPPCHFCLQLICARPPTAVYA